jgi:molecular chaperone IbpA
MTFSNFKNFEHFFVGSDHLVKRVAEAAATLQGVTQNYPPYNLLKIDANSYAIEMSVAGFAKKDLSVELTDGNLIVKGTAPKGHEAEQTTDGDWTWPAILYRGLAMRSFTRQWILADNIEVTDVSLKDGILKIALLEQPLESKKIKINIAGEE